MEKSTLQWESKTTAKVTLTTKEDDSILVKQIKGVIQKDIAQCYQGEGIITLLKVAMFLEPRFKETPFLNRAEKQQVKVLTSKFY